MDSQSEHAANIGLSSTMTTQFLVGTVVALFFVFVFLFCLYIYAKGYSGGSSSILSSRFILPVDHPMLRRGGLDPEAIRALPITLFRQENFKEGLECSVCLTELNEGEDARILPKCSHGFHLECIDMWFHSHSTCPLCRSPVVPDPLVSLPPQDAVLVDIPTVVDSSFAANSSSGSPAPGPTEGSSSSRGSCSGAKRKGMLVVEIPRRGGGGGMSSSESPLPTSRASAGEMKTPVSGRTRTMRRMLSRGSRGVGGGAMWSPRGGDVERGGAGEGSRAVPRTPKDL